VVCGGVCVCVWCGVVWCGVCGQCVVLVVVCVYGVWVCLVVCVCVVC